MSKTIFITGAAKRIGKALALRFAQQGYNIAINYFHSEQEAEKVCAEIESYGVKANLFKADVKSHEALSEAIQQAHNYFGAIDILINNAGIYPEPKNILEIKPEEWGEVFETNLNPSFFAAQAFVRVAKQGRIINISSLGGVQVWKDRIPYNTSKGALIHFTKVLARALAPNFTVNSVAPGAINIATEPVAGELISVKKIPMQRYGTTDDIFDAANFFATSTNYITGQTLILDGGLHIAQETIQG